MPANLTPQYFEAEKRYRNAETPDDRIVALQEMLTAMPKHKGTDGLRAELRTKIAKLSKEAAKAQATARRGGMYHIPTKDNLKRLSETWAISVVPNTKIIYTRGMTNYEKIRSDDSGQAE